MVDTAFTPALDGRHRRALRSQRAIIEAALALVRETGEPPVPDAVAARAGVSRRTIFRLFDDLDSLHAELIAHQRAEVLRRFPPPLEFTAPLGRRLAQLVRHRAAVYEYILPLRAVAERRAHEHPVVAEGMRQARRELRAHLELMLGGAFDGLPAPQRRDRLDGAEMLLSPSSWRTLRRDQGRSRVAAERILRAALFRLVDYAAPGAEDEGE